MTLVLTAYEAELTKIADWKMRAGEAALGALAGAGAGYASARDKDRRNNDEAAAALAGAVLGAGGGVGLSAVIRSLQARALINKELPAALEAGKAALAPLAIGKDAGKVLAEARKVAAREQPKRQAHLEKVVELAQSKIPGQKAEDFAQHAQDRLQASKTLQGKDVGDALSRIRRSYIAPIAEAEAAIAATSGKERKRWIAHIRSLKEDLGLDLENVKSGQGGPKNPDSVQSLRVARDQQRVSEGIPTVRSSMSSLDARRKRAAREMQQIEAAKKTVTNLEAAKAALDDARKVHGDRAVTEATRSKAHDTYAQKLFGLIG